MYRLIKSNQTAHVKIVASGKLNAFVVSVVLLNTINFAIKK